MSWIRDVAAAGLVWALLLGGQAVAEELEQIQVVFDGQGGVDGLAGARDIAVSPDGFHVYVAGADDDAIAVFERDVDGELDQVQVLFNTVDGVIGIGGANAVTVSPDGLHVYATGPENNAVAVFERDPVLGTLTFVEWRRNGAGDITGGLVGPTDVDVSPDGAHVYISAQTFSTVAIFSRDVVTGRLGFVGFIQDGVDASGLSSASSIHVSPDDAHVYVTALGEDALSVFSRDTVTGELTEVEVQREGENGVDGISTPSKVEVSDDGNQVYVASFGDSAVTIFDRDAASGALTFVESVQDGVDGVEGLLSTQSVTVDPGGTRVYSVALDDNSLSSFERQAETGLLTQYDLATDGLAGVDGLMAPRAVAVSDDSQNVYTASGTEGSVAAFLTHVPPGPPDPPGPLPPGSGTDLDGATMEFEWRFLSVDGMLVEGPTAFVVEDPGGPELSDILSGADLEVSATNLRLDWLGNANYSRNPPTFNGGVFEITSNTAPIESVSVADETNLSGFDETRIEFDAKQITLNLAGLSAMAGSVVSVDIALLIPEPTTGGVVAALLGLAVLGWRRARLG